MASSATLPVIGKEDRVIKPNAGPQMAAFASKADVLIFGGSAGGGKTFYIINEPLRHANNPGFRATIFRRTYPEIKSQGGLWDEARAIYPLFGAKMREGQDLDATFPSGARIAFCHLQYEQTKYEHQGDQITLIEFDELTHFSETQFFYMLSRNRSMCGVKPYIRCSCNPDAGSWVAQFIGWWIDQESGFPIPERSGVIRYFIRENNETIWGDTKQELMNAYPEYDASHILSFTFIQSKLDDNPMLLKKDPGYRARLKALPLIERERLEKGNWKAAEGSIINLEWLKHYTMAGDVMQCTVGGRLMEIHPTKCRRFATIDTAGTSKELAAERRGDPPSWSVVSIWDHYRVQNGVENSDVLLLHHVWRGQVGWNELKVIVPETLSTHNVHKVFVENAHYGKPLADELRPKGFQVDLIGPVIPGMDDSSRGAKLERAIASGLLARLETGTMLIPSDDSPQWVKNYKRELSVWTGLPKETADQIDVSSYAAYVSRKQVQSWGGVLKRG